MAKDRKEKKMGGGNEGNEKAEVETAKRKDGHERTTGSNK